MAIMATTTMNGAGRQGTEEEEEDGHENDVVMPGFRFHPTEEELIEFYLRRKVEGKRFNVELITFLDLYRYDPWDLPALAAIGEKEWFFYVPRDRKYRNGDRPNRVTRSGYWKATGADRVIRGEDSRSMGLKKTLVFYSGKAPKGVRTSWIMNEYRLPHSETDRYQKAEISLCRVYKRAGIDNMNRSSTTTSSSSRQAAAAAAQRTSSSSNYKNILGTTAGGGDSYSSPSSSSIGRDQDHDTGNNFGSLLLLNAAAAAAASVDDDDVMITTTVGLGLGDDQLNINRTFNNVSYSQSQQLHYPNLPTAPQPQQQQLLLPPLNNMQLPPPAAAAAAAAAHHKLWEWNILPESSGKDYSTGFK